MAEAYSPLGGPVAVDKMEEVQLRNKAGRIEASKPMEVSESRRPMMGLPEPTWKGPDIGTLTYTAM